jgi:2-polyprenyl-6-methoxyphenol hydroxylase-like FAD-dependent oxidoreductase
MNLGIEDAHAFARRLAERKLDGYTAERHPIGHRWIVLSERLLGAVQSANPVAIPLRNLAIRTIGRLPALQKPMMERLAGLRE